MYNPEHIQSIFDVAKSRYKIQQKPEEWIPFLNWLDLNCASERFEHILDIGAYDGGTTYCFAQFCKTLTTVDIISPARFDCTEIQAFCEHRYIGQSSHLPDTVQQVADRQYDLIFIDGDHTYEGVKKDFELYLPFLKRGGAVIFHDIVDSQMHRNLNCHVAKFWKEVKTKYKNITFCQRETAGQDNNWGGIGLIFP